MVQTGVYSNAVGPFEKAIRNAVREGDVLATPGQSKPFRIGKLSAEGIILELGAKLTPTFFSWVCIEGVLPLLQKHGRIRINGSGKSQEIVQGTLDGYLKIHVNRLTAGWVAALLEKAGAAVIERSRPAHLRAVP
jgi:hypothetical protein